MNELNRFERVLSVITFLAIVAIMIITLGLAVKQIRTHWADWTAQIKPIITHLASP